MKEPSYAYLTLNYFTTTKIYENNIRSDILTLAIRGYYILAK